VKIENKISGPNKKVVYLADCAKNKDDSNEEA